MVGGEVPYDDFESFVAADADGDGRITADELARVKPTAEQVETQQTLAMPPGATLSDVVRARLARRIVRYEGEPLTR